MLVSHDTTFLFSFSQRIRTQNCRQNICNNSKTKEKNCSQIKTETTESYGVLCLLNKECSWVFLSKTCLKLEMFNSNARNQRKYWTISDQISWISLFVGLGNRVDLRSTTSVEVSAQSVGSIGPGSANFWHEVGAEDRELVSMSTSIEDSSSEITVWRVHQS